MKKDLINGLNLALKILRSNSDKEMAEFEIEEHINNLINKKVS